MRVLHTPLEAQQWLQAQATRTLKADSRQVREGDAFLAWPGTARDARAHVADALGRGAVACMVEAQGIEAWTQAWPEQAPVALYPELQRHAGPVAALFNGDASADMQIVAVTGTNAKTSIAWWTAAACQALPGTLSRRCAMVGTLGVGIAPQLTSTGMTTPDPILLQGLWRQWRDQGVRTAVIEASSIGLQEQRLAGTRIHTAVFSNFTQDHLDYHGSMAAYWQAKRALFDWPGLQAAVINIDDAQGRALARELQARADHPKLDVWTCSQHDETARLRASNVRLTAEGQSCTVHERLSDGALLQVELTAPVLGAYNIDNLLAVVGALRSLGVPLHEAVAACRALPPVPGRMEMVRVNAAGAAPLPVVDYAHTPDAVAKALAALRPLATQRGGRLWCLIGCGGDRDPHKRPLMASQAERNADVLVLTSDNPRSEDPMAILAQMQAGLRSLAGVTIESDRARAIAQAVQRADASDVILIAGKGHECEQEIAGRKTPFSDVAHARAALVTRSAAGGGHG